MTWYEIESSQRLLSKLHPSQITASPLQRIEDYNLWPPPRRTRRKSAKRPAAVVPRSSQPSASTQIPLQDGMADDTESDSIDLQDQDEELEDAVDDGVPDENMDLLLQSESLQEMYNEPASQLPDLQLPQQHPPQAGTMATASASVDVAPPLEPHIDEPSVPAAVAVPQPPDADRVDIQPPDDAPDVPAHPRRAARGVQGVAAAAWYCDGGRISYYPLKNSFEAVCFDRNHGPPGSCVLTRTSKGRKARGVETTTAGRPLGMLALWLSRHHDYLSRDAHKSKENLRTFTQEARHDARLNLLSTEAGRSLAAFERDQLAGEPLEPESLTGLV